MLGNQLGHLNLSEFVVPKAYASSTKSSASPNVNHNELNIVAILVEDSLLDDKTNYTTSGSKSTLREHVFAYAQNIQKRLPHTKAIVIGVNPKESTKKINSNMVATYNFDIFGHITNNFAHIFS